MTFWAWFRNICCSLNLCPSESMIMFQLNNFEMRYSGLQQEALQTQDKNRQSLQELSAKEEETVVIKVELSALQEKFKIKCNEVRIWIRSFSFQIRVCTGLRNHGCHHEAC